METKVRVNTIDIQAKEWFDKVNGNSYFAGKVIVNKGTDNVREFIMPFQYGYGDSYKYAGLQLLVDEKLIYERFSLYEMKERGILFNAYIERNCLKRELKEFK